MTHNALKHMGLREMEAAVLARLVRRPGVTGYQIARAIDKPAANVYAALESLSRRGLATATAGRPRRWHAPSPGDIVRAFDRDARRRRRELCAALGVPLHESPDPATADERARAAVARIARALEEGIDIDALEALCQEVVGSVPAADSTGAPTATAATEPTDPNVPRTIGPASLSRAYGRTTERADSPSEGDYG